MMCRGTPELVIWGFSILFLASFSSGFNPMDNYLIDCGASTNSSVGNRVFVADNLTSNLLSTSHDVLAKTTLKSVPPSEYPVLLQTARVFNETSKCTFPIKQSGRHWIRLYFYPFSYNSYDMSSANFAVSTPDHVLLSNFSVQNKSVVKEFSVNVTSNNLIITFTPSSNSIAFLNAIEVVSVPDWFISNDAIGVSQAGNSVDLLRVALETVWRVNMGGPMVTADNDTLWRTWIPDQRFLIQANLIASYSNITALKYVRGGAMQDSAPNTVYGTARGMNTTGVPDNNYGVNLRATWEFNVVPGFQYLLRFHICDIVSKSVDELSFDVFVNSSLVKTVNRSSVPVPNILAAAFYIDFVTMLTITNKLRISVGWYVASCPCPNGILNGLEIMKMNNIVGSLSSGALTVSPGLSSKKNVGLTVGVIVGPLVAAILAGILCLWWRNRSRLSPQGHSKTWIPLPINGGNSPFMGIKYSDPIYRYRVPFAAVQESTNNFDESWVIGVGGFGKVYKGVLNGTKVAVKRSNPLSQQGITEFQTELVMLSQFRHRHLVSLVGYCDEENEMILIYEFMENGTLKSHLYGSGLPSLSWKQRLEICIGAARGLHYLHTGQKKAVIHRDVKSVNILLDENLMAKVADFGLSRPGPEIDQTHVSTKVKGTFGYLDPEYFRTQRLTEKSGVYSFGVVLFEVLCARSVTDPSQTDLVGLAEWAMTWQRRGQLEQILDPPLVGKIKPNSLRKYVETAEKCLAHFGANRPSMGDVLWNLEYALQLQEVVVDGNFEENGTITIGELPTRVNNLGDSNGSIYAMQLKASSMNDLSGDSTSKALLTRPTVSATF